MNPVLFTVYDTTPAQHALSVAAFESILKQDVPVHVYVLDNGSTHQETVEWIRSIATPEVTVSRNEWNESPVKLHNFWLGEIFGRLGHQHVLAVPSDVRLPANCYSQLLRWPRGFVSASDNGRNEPAISIAMATSECTPMAVMLIRSWAHQAIVAKDGYFFDEQLQFYCSDCDLALRMAACGIRGVQTNVPFWHYGSASWRLADFETAEAIVGDADMDRLRFTQKWGFSVESPAYTEAASNINFLGEGNAK